MNMRILIRDRQDAKSLSRFLFRNAHAFLTRTQPVNVRDDQVRLRHVARRFRVWILDREEAEFARSDGEECRVRLHPLTLEARAWRSAALVADGFNREMLATGGTLWAIALPELA